MSVFAPEEAMSDSGNHPPLEELAAYIDGLLPKEEAIRVAEHISGCEDCFFVYSETVRFQLEHPDEAENPVPEPGKVVPFPPKTEKTERERTRRRWPAAVALPIAAALAIAIGIPLYLNFIPPSLPQVTTAELVEPVQEIPGIEDRLYRYKVTRGGAEGESESDLNSFIIGSAFVDLRLSLQAGDVEASSTLLHKIGASIKEIDITPDLGLALIQKSHSLKSPADLQRLLPETAQWETEIRADDGSWMVTEDYFTFGQWAEAARLAADLRKQEFFDDRENWRVLSYILKSKEMNLSDKVAADLREIEKIWDKGNLQPQDFTALAGKLKEIIQAYDVIS